MRGVWLLSMALLVAGVALIAWGVVHGGAKVALVVVVPVLYGSSVPFVLGVFLVFVGFLSLPFTLAEREEEGVAPGAAMASGEERSGAVEGGVGGFVLIGPVPIVFGSWKGVSRRTRWALALGGAVLLTAVVVALVWLLR